MRAVYRNPMFYYLLIPVLVGLWPLLVWGVYLPRAEQARETEGGLCVEGMNHVIDILTIDPDRPNFTGTTSNPVGFSYTAAVGQAASLCGIPSRSWTSTAGGMMESGGKKRQDARVKLTDVTIVQTAKFLSTIQSMWVTLTCDSVKLQKRKGELDKWDVDLSFLYLY